MKKKIKKIISVVFPKGEIKEKIKLVYYSINKPKSTKYELLRGNENVMVFKTTHKQISLITNEALYFVVWDFEYYQHFYRVKQDDIVIDAGANCGHLSILFSKLVGENGIIYAFEPDRYNIKRILKNKHLNEDLLNNIVIEDMLLWNENTLIDFNEAGTVASSVVWISESDKCIKKQAIRIDDWVAKNNLKKLDFIKMDIEGAETEALEGCIETIKKYKPNFAIASYHIVNGQATYIKVEEFFKKINYPFKTVRFRGNEIITFAGESVIC